MHERLPPEAKPWEGSQFDSGALGVEARSHFLSRRGEGQSLRLSWEQVLCRMGIGNLSQAAGIQTHMTLQRPYLDLIHCMYPKPLEHLYLAYATQKLMNAVSLMFLF